MELWTPAQITNPAFDGFLEPLPSHASMTTRGGQLTRARLGRPAWWSAAEMFGENWKPPRGGDVYLLVRLACSLQPGAGQEVQEASLTAYLHCRGTDRQPVAFDLFPREVKEEAQTDLTLSLGPELKFGVVEGSLASAGATIHVPRVEPVIVTSGLGEANPTWIFRRHRKHPLEGSRLVYAVVARPADARELRLSLELAATVADRYGPVRVGVPEPARANLSWVIS